jgi:hypothetical protein
MITAGCMCVCFCIEGRDKFISKVFFFFHLFGFDIARQILIEKERNIYIDFFSVRPRFIDEEDYDN